jgi:hypothetical protein
LRYGVAMFLSWATWGRTPRTPAVGLEKSIVSHWMRGLRGFARACMGLVNFDMSSYISEIGELVC